MESFIDSLGNQSRVAIFLILDENSWFYFYLSQKKDFRILKRLFLVDGVRNQNSKILDIQCTLLNLASVLRKIFRMRTVHQCFCMSLGGRRNDGSLQR